MNSSELKTVMVDLFASLSDIFRNENDEENDIKNAEELVAEFKQKFSNESFEGESKDLSDAFLKASSSIIEFKKSNLIVQKSDEYIRGHVNKIVDASNHLVAFYSLVRFMKDQV